MVRSRQSRVFTAQCWRIMIGGLFRIVTPSLMHLLHRGWLLLSGVVTLLLGVYI